jgi:hypothetical protein
MAGKWKQWGIRYGDGDGDAPVLSLKTAKGRWQEISVDDVEMSSGNIMFLWKGKRQATVRQGDLYPKKAHGALPDLVRGDPATFERAVTQYFNVCCAHVFCVSLIFFLAVIARRGR